MLAKNTSFYEDDGFTNMPCPLFWPAKSHSTVTVKPAVMITRGISWEPPVYLTMAGSSCGNPMNMSAQWNLDFVFPIPNEALLLSLPVSTLEFLSWPDRKESLQSRVWLKNTKQNFKCHPIPDSIFKSAGKSFGWIIIQWVWIWSTYGKWKI